MHTKVVETDRGPVEYSEAGTGAPILYFHGTGVTGEVMLRVESRLIDDSFRLIIPNRPGYGRTPLSPNESAADCGNVTIALLDSLGISNVHVMGSSGGAAYASSFAIRHPKRANSLVLLCPQLHRWDHKRWLPKSSRWTLPILKRPLLRKLLFKLYGLQLPRLSVKRYLKMQAGERYADVADDPASRDLCALALAALRDGTKYAGFENDFIVFINEDIVGGLRSTQTPMLVIHDAHDPMAPVDHVEWFVSNFQQCKRLSVHTAGHLVWVGPDADVMHQIRVQFLNDHAKIEG